MKTILAAILLCLSCGAMCDDWHTSSTGVTFNPVQESSFSILGGGQARLIFRPDGSISWKGREVETDAEFRQAVIELMLYIGGHNCPRRE